jgi:TNF receptor-associated protein 1
VRHQVIRFLETEAKRDPEAYKNKFFKEFGFFLKEGVCQDFENQVRPSGVPWRGRGR